MGLPPKILDAYPHQFSGGMRQRVTIALATLLKPRIIIGDEPTTALDVVVQRGVVQLLKDVQRELQNTIILVTHDMGVHANVADRIGIMYAGKIVEEAPTEKIFRRAGPPYTQYLINSLPKFGDKTTARERARQPAFAGEPAQRLSLPPALPARRRRSANSRCRASPKSTQTTKLPAGWSEKEKGTMEKLLEVENLTKVFSIGSMLSRVRITAVDNISFYIAPAEIFALAGESGCGKTTTARIIMGFEHATSGTIVHSGKKESQEREGLVHRWHPGDLPGSLWHLQPAAHGRPLFLRDGAELQAGQDANRRPST